MKLNRFILFGIFLIAVLSLAPICAGEDMADDSNSSSEDVISSPIAEDTLAIGDDENNDEGNDSGYYDDVEYEDGGDEYPAVNLKVFYTKTAYVDNPTDLKFTGSDFYWGKIKATLNGKTFTGGYDNGKATVTVKSSKVGTQKISYRTAFDVGDYDTVGEITIKFVKRPVLKASNVKMFTVESKNYKVRLLDGKGKVLAGKTIRFYVDGSKINVAKTDKKGYATAKISKLYAGTHKIKMVYDGVTFTKKVKVKSIFKGFKKTSAKNADAVKLTLKTKKVKGKYLKGKKVTFNIMGKKFKAKINSKGIVKLSVKKSAFKKSTTNKDEYTIVDAYYKNDYQWCAISFSKLKPKMSYKILTKIDNVVKLVNFDS